MEEIWKGVIYQGIDWSWRLEVSNLGQLRNTKTKHIYNLFLSNGYYRVPVSIKGERKSFFIHRCVAETFIENTYDKNMVVNHKNGIKTDNFVENLEFVTQAENLSHAVKTGLRKVHGVENSLSKLSISDIEFIIKNHKRRDKEFGIKALAAKYSVNKNTISRIINGESYINEVKSIKKDLMED